MRLPSLLGGALYLAMAFRVSRRLVGDGPRLPVLVALLVLHPYVLDFLSAARGYGLALGFLFWALDVLLQSLGEGPGTNPASRGHGARASVALGLAVASNLAFLFPAVALAAAFVAIWLARTERGTPAISRLIGRLVLPGLLVAAGLMAGPLSAAS